MAFQTGKTTVWDRATPNDGLLLDAEYDRLYENFKEFLERGNLIVNNSAESPSSIQLTNVATGANSTNGLKIETDSAGEAVINQQENLNLVIKTNNSTRLTIDNNGTATFTSIPVLPANNPVSDNQAARKAYVDGQISQQISNHDSQHDDRFVQLSSNQSISGVKTFTDSTNATNKDTGALVLANGGLGVEGNIYAGGLISAGGAVCGTSLNTGSGNISGGSLSGTTLTISSAQQSTSKDTGAIVVQNGGLGVESNIYAGGLISAGGAVSGSCLNVGSGSISGGAISASSLNTGSGSITGGAISGSSVSAGSGNIAGGTLGVSGSITGASLNVGSGSINGGAISGSSVSAGSGNIAGGTLGVSGAITGASLNVGGGSMNGASVGVNSAVYAYSSDWSKYGYVQHNGTHAYIGTNSGDVVIPHNLHAQCNIYTNVISGSSLSVTGAVSGGSVSAGASGITSTGLINSSSCIHGLTTAAFSAAIFGCACGYVSHGVCGTACFGDGVKGIGTNGVSGCGNDNGVHGTSNTCRGVYGYTCSGISVGGNTPYNSTSSKYLKYKDNICISQCLKDKPLSVYKYLYEDSNYQGFSEFVGPTAQDINYTFNLTSDKENLFSVDGIALGLGIEHLKRLDEHEEKINKLENKIKKLTKTISALSK